MTNVRVKIWLDDGTFEASYAIPITASKEQIEHFTQQWLGTLKEAIAFLPTAAKGEPQNG